MDRGLLHPRQKSKPGSSMWTEPLELSWQERVVVQILQRHRENDVFPIARAVCENGLAAGRCSGAFVSGNEYAESTIPPAQCDLVPDAAVPVR